MKANNFILPDYLARIGFSGEARADFDALTTIMRHQLFSVPFENLDVQAGKVVSLVPEEIVDKIVQRRRGGYCYEVNGLFAMALEALGVPYQFVAARPMIYPARRPRTHMAIVATLDGEPWLFDLGFGGSGIRAPMRLGGLGAEIRQDYDSYRLLASESGGYLLQTQQENDWANQYEFNLSLHEWVDFVPANNLNSTHPDTIFVQKLLVVLHTPAGRKILFGDTFKTVERGVTTKGVIGAEDIPRLLREEFGLISPA